MGFPVSDPFFPMFLPGHIRTPPKQKFPLHLPPKLRGGIVPLFFFCQNFSLVYLELLPPEFPTYSFARLFLSRFSPPNFLARKRCRLLFFRDCPPFQAVFLKPNGLDSCTPPLTFFLCFHNLQRHHLLLPTQMPGPPCAPPASHSAFPYRLKGLNAYIKMFGPADDPPLKKLRVFSVPCDPPVSTSSTFFFCCFLVFLPGEPRPHIPPNFSLPILTEPPFRQSILPFFPILHSIYLVSPPLEGRYFFFSLPLQSSPSVVSFDA